jgi:hypothetical protein
MAMSPGAGRTTGCGESWSSGPAPRPAATPAPHRPRLGLAATIQGGHHEEIGDDPAGTGISEIARDLRVTPGSVRRWRAWLDGGPAALKSKGPVSRERLSPQQWARLDAELRRRPLWLGCADDQRWTLGRIKTLIGRLFHAGRRGHLEAADEPRGSPRGPQVEYADHYNTHRPRRALRQNPPAGRAHPSAEMTGVRVLRRDRLGGLIHEYAQVA